jgi:hypothetical protein
MLLSTQNVREGLSCNAASSVMDASVLVSTFPNVSTFLGPRIDPTVS